jgi:hypothetical protein
MQKNLPARELTVAAMSYDLYGLDLGIARPETTASNISDMCRDGEW